MNRSQLSALLSVFLHVGGQTYGLGHNSGGHYMLGEATQLASFSLVESLDEIRLPRRLWSPYQNTFTVLH